MRAKFDEQLLQLNNMLIEMGALTETAIDLASRAMKEQNIVLAKEVLSYEQEIDQKEKDIEDLCLKLLLRQQPVARDLRLISAVLKMITDIERIGDQAADIAELVIMLADSPYIKKLEHIPQMALATMKMVTESVNAFVKRDLNLAEAVIKYDDKVDTLFDLVKFDLIKLIRANAANSEQAVDLLMIAKYFERIGDHAVNVAEWIVFAITGKHNKDNAELNES
jgi:phosphate transport system protein